MKLSAIAPHLAGRMLPELFSCMPDFKSPRFEGDPWATFPHAPAVHWMHSTDCPRGAGAVTSKRFEPHYRPVLVVLRQADLFGGLDA